MRLGHFLDARDPVLDQAVVVVGHGGADTAALVVAAHDDVLDLFILVTKRGKGEHCKNQGVMQGARSRSCVRQNRPSKENQPSGKRNR